MKLYLPFPPINIVYGVERNKVYVGKPHLKTKKISSQILEECDFEKHLTFQLLFQLLTITVEC